MSGPEVALAVMVLSTAAAFMYLRDPIRAWRRYRGARLVTCPETAAAAAVSIDVGHAALTAFIEGRPVVRLAGCSRWPERGRCSEPCLLDVERAGDAAKVAAIVGRWYQTQTCGYCGRPIAVSESPQHAPALIGPDGASVAWCDIPAEQLPNLLRTARAVCCHCHIAESFRRTHPELVVDR
jgi:hypothetical protein